jgi:hypothetical protein
VKVAIQCDSPLLQRSLELFLDGHLTSYRHCDVLIRDKDIRNDEQLTFVIGAQEGSDLIKPFSKAQLFHALAQAIEESKATPLVQTDTEFYQENIQESVSFDILERHIDKITREYQANILKAIRAFYEK